MEPSSDMRNIFLVIVALLAASAALRESLYAATLILRPEYVATRSIVVLGDLAEITDCDTESATALAQIPLFPSPPLGVVRYLSLQEIRDILTLRGIDTSVHEWQGARQVKILSTPKTASVEFPNTRGPEHISSQFRDRAQSRLEAALSTYLKTQYPELPPFDSSVSLDDEAIRWLAAAEVVVTVQADIPLATDRRRFTVLIKAPGGQRTMTVDAQLRPAPQAVVAARPLSRDAVLSAEDVQLAPVNTLSPEYLASIEEVVGRQITTGLPPGKPITRSMLRDPVLVKRGEVVHVVVRAPGVVIRTLGRAKEDGILGRPVPLETLDVRGKTIVGRVTDRQTVEVFASSVLTGSENR